MSSSSTPSIRVRRLAQTLRLIRLARQLKTREAGAAMGIGKRRYEYLEAGVGEADFERIKGFAELSHSDPYAICVAPWINSPAFALRTADNKLVTAFLIALREFDQALGDDIAQLDASSYMAAFNQAFEQLTVEVKRKIALREALSPDRLSRPPGPPDAAKD